eukprot:SAG22_NODE_1491_length_4306_cov_16.877823_4_plen_202_part_00
MPAATEGARLSCADLPAGRARAEDGSPLAALPRAAEAHLGPRVPTLHGTAWHRDGGGHAAPGRAGGPGVPSPGTSTPRRARARGPGAGRGRGIGRCIWRVAKRVRVKDSRGQLYNFDSRSLELRLPHPCGLQLWECPVALLGGARCAGPGGPPGTGRASKRSVARRPATRAGHRGAVRRCEQQPAAAGGGQAGQQHAPRWH